MGHVRCGCDSDTDYHTPCPLVTACPCEHQALKKKNKKEITTSFQSNSGLIRWLASTGGPADVYTLSMYASIYRETPTMSSCHISNHHLEVVLMHIPQILLCRALKDIVFLISSDTLLAQCTGGRVMLPAAQLIRLCWQKRTACKCLWKLNALL